MELGQEKDEVGMQTVDSRLLLACQDFPSQLLASVSRHGAHSSHTTKQNPIQYNPTRIERTHTQSMTIYSFDPKKNTGTEKSCSFP